MLDVINVFHDDVFSHLDLLLDEVNSSVKKSSK